jgi:hypothetical protein
LLAARAEHEIADRGRRRIERHLAEPRLLVGKTFDSFGFDPVPVRLQGADDGARRRRQDNGPRAAVRTTSALSAPRCGRMRSRAWLIRLRKMRAGVCEGV